MPSAPRPTVSTAGPPAARSGTGNRSGLTQRPGPEESALEPALDGQAGPAAAALPELDPVLDSAAGTDPKELLHRTPPRFRQSAGLRNRATLSRDFSKASRRALTSKAGPRDLAASEARSIRRGVLLRSVFMGLPHRVSLG